MRHTYKTQGTCATEIQFDLNSNIVTGISFTGGCNGNLKALSALADGLTADEIINKCKGINCGEGFKSRGTSCAAQLALAVEKAKGLNT